MGQESLEAVLNVLVESVRSSMLDAVLAVGEVLFEQVYDGDEARVRSRGRKDISLEDIASQPGSGVSASWLCRAVNIYLQRRELPDELALKLSVSHHRQLLRVDRREDKAKLAGLAVESSWTVKRLEGRVNTLLRERSGRGGRTTKTEGRPRVGPLEHTRRGLELIEGQLADDRGEIELMSPPYALGLVGDLKRTLLRVLARLEAIEGSLLAKESCRVATLVGPPLLGRRDRPVRPGSGFSTALPPADPQHRAAPPPDPGVP